MPGIFISYRREDTQALAGRLFDRLARHFGPQQVFRDIDTIPPGAEFAEFIARRISSCDALIALIGPGWLEAKDSAGQLRLHLPNDFVKQEIAAALQQGKLVIPALIEPTRMPAAAALSAELTALTARNALAVSDSRFDFDIGRLITALETVVACVAATQPAAAHFAVSASAGGIAIGGGVSAAPGGVAVVATGPVNIGITLEQFLAGLRARELEIRAEIAQANQADKERITVLERELAAAQSQASSAPQSLEKYQEVLSNAGESLGRMQAGASPAGLEMARQSLARGETAQAEELFGQTLAQGKIAAEAAFQLAELAKGRIDYATASRYYAEAVKLQPENSLYVNEAGVMAFTLARFEDAEPLMRRAQQIDEASFGSDHPKVAIRLNNLAQLLKATNRLADAEPLMRRALQIDEASFGSDHPNVARDLNNLAQLLQATNRLADAEPLMRRAVQIFSESLGAEHPNTVTVLGNYRLLLAKMKS